MSVKDKYTVLPIHNRDCKDWILNKHYAKKMCKIVYPFGIYENNVLQGICTFGTPSSASLTTENMFTDIFDCRILELNRLVVNENLMQNTLSYFVSNCLRLIQQKESKCAIVSYADLNNNHHGYIYQATNWIYTGLGGDTIRVTDSNGKSIHTKTLSDRNIRTHEDIIKNGYIIERILKKHRYFMFLGTKKDIKKMKSLLKYEILPYPKGDNKRYDADYNATVNGILF